VTEPVGGPEPETAEQRSIRLAAAATALVAELEEFSDDAGVQFVTLAKRAQQNRVLIWIGLVLVALGIGLSVVVGLTVLQVQDNSRTNSELTHRLDVSQTVTRKNTLCPLYILLRAGDTKAARDASKDKAAFDKSYMVINQGYAALNCQEFTPSPVPSPTAAP
jgi:hypothetical protein